MRNGLIIKNGFCHEVKVIMGFFKLRLLCIIGFATMINNTLVLQIIVSLC